MKVVSCPRDQLHQFFRRTVIVEGPTTEVVDTALQTIEVEDCREFRLVRRITGIYCRICGAQALIKFGS